MTPEQIEFYEKLTPEQKTVATLVFSGVAYVEVHHILYPDSGVGNSEAARRIKEIVKSPQVQDWLAVMRNEIVSDAIMSRQEALERLSRIARTSIADIAKFTNDEESKQGIWAFKNSALIDKNRLAAVQELKNTRSGLSLKLYSAVDAIKQIAELEGWYKPRRIDHTSIDGSMTPTVAPALDVSKLSDNTLAELMQAFDSSSE